MKASQKGIDLIKSFEGCRLTAYADAIGVWTIGWGNTQHEDGRRVRQGDKITQQQADELLINKVNNVYAPGVEKQLRIGLDINQNQFDALVSFAYNCGIGNLQKSSLMRAVNTNPSDPSIRAKFEVWNKAGGKVLAGLTRRRKAEADLYFS